MLCLTLLRNSSDCDLTVAARNLFWWNTPIIVFNNWPNVYDNFTLLQLTMPNINGRANSSLFLWSCSFWISGLSSPPLHVAFTTVSNTSYGSLSVVFSCPSPLASPSGLHLFSTSVSSKTTTTKNKYSSGGVTNDIHMICRVLSYLYRITYAHLLLSPPFFFFPYRVVMMPSTHVNLWYFLTKLLPNLILY